MAAGAADIVSPLSLKPPTLKGGKDAEAEYVRIARELSKIGHINALQRQNLINYCEAYALAQEALDELRIDGVTLESEKTGGKYQHPALAAFSAMRNIMESEAKTLGMTPLSLQSIKSVKPKKNAKTEGGPSEFL